MREVFENRVNYLKKINWLDFVIISLVISSIVSFWAFARFTVDDAFISWRFGKNLVDAGIWNYNPSTFDMTQSYTSPLFAILSIIPNYLSIDVVLFFKIISLLITIIFFFWFDKKVKNNLIMILIFLTLPATMIHIFAGLETFVFVILISMLLIYLYENKLSSTIIISMILMLTRPETFTLLLLVPLYFAFEHSKYSREGNIKERLLHLLNWKQFLKWSLLLSALLITYLLFNFFHFGYPLPTSFYVKTTNVFSITQYIWFSFFTIPLWALIPTDNFEVGGIKKIKILIFSYLFFGSMIFIYSRSALQMNYMGRFEFHIFAPIYLFITYIISKQNRYLYLSSSATFDKYYKLPFVFLIKGLLLLSLLVFSLYTMNLFGIAQIINYYPRAIDAHSALGKVLNILKEKENLKAFSFGDAGMTAYYSEMIAFDNLGLGSSAVTHTGVTYELLNSYDLDVILFYAKPSGVNFSRHSQNILQMWANDHNLAEVCSVYWHPTYLITIYAKEPYPEFYAVCEDSKNKNNISNRNYFYRTIFRPPWYYWRE
jgi:hypothetical protein